MQRLFLGLIAATALIAAVGFLLLLCGALDESAEGASLTHMHCPKCRLEMLFDATLQGKPCPRCGPTGPQLTATAGPRGSQVATVGPVGKALVALLVLLILSEALIYVFVLYQRSRRAAVDQEGSLLLVCKCPFCTRRIGYVATMIGTGACCPRCKTAFVLPQGSDALEEA